MPTDALGLTLRRHIENANANVMETLEFSGGLQDKSPVARYFERGDRSPVDAWCVDALGNLGEQFELVDIGTGVGRYALDVQEQHPTASVVGVEISPGAAEIACSRGLRTICENFRALRFERKVDALSMLGNNLGLLGYEESIRETLLKLHGWVKPGGVLVGSAGTPDLLPQPLQGLVTKKCPGTFSARHVIDEFRGPWFEYSFFDPEYFLQWVPTEKWEAEEVLRHEKRWGIRLRSV